MTETLASVIWALCVAAWVAIRLPRRRKARKTAVASDRKSMSERLTLLLCIVGFFVVPAVHVLTDVFSFADYRFHPLSGWLGLACGIFFVVLFYLCHKQLKHNWSVTLELRENHQLIDTGLYSQIRHPMYTSFVLWGISQWLLLPNWLAGPAGLFSIAVLFFARVDKEENMMRSQFGSRYDEYCKRTKRLIPKVY